MKLVAITLTAEGGFVGMRSSGDLRGWFFWGKSQAKELARKLRKRDRREFLKDVLDSPMPEDTPRSPVAISGGCVATIANLASFVGRLAQGTGLARITAPPAGEVYYTFLPPEPTGKDAVIGWSDPAGTHHLAVIYSAIQGRQLITELAWLDAATQRAIIADIEAVLRGHAETEAVRVSGQLVGFMNSAYWLEKAVIASRSKEAN